MILNKGNILVLCLLASVAFSSAYASKEGLLFLTPLSDDICSHIISFLPARSSQLSYYARHRSVLNNIAEDIVQQFLLFKKNKEDMTLEEAQQHASCFFATTKKYEIQQAFRLAMMLRVKSQLVTLRGNFGFKDFALQPLLAATETPPQAACLALFACQKEMHTRDISEVFAKQLPVSISSLLKQDCSRERWSLLYECAPELEDIDMKSCCQGLALTIFCPWIIPVLIVKKLVRLAETEYENASTPVAYRSSENLWFGP